jgi:rRNA maturation RNase YbeY
MAEKVNPYLRPLYDALHDMTDFDKAQRLIERGTIEVAPLAFMRGRTLNESFVILDEAQNSTVEQMKMFLTRLGYSSKAVVTGDVTQTDLPSGKPSGLIDALEVLKDVEGIGIQRFTEADVVRHPLVQSIVRAYERRDAASEVRPAAPPDVGARAGAWRHSAVAEALGYAVRTVARAGDDATGGEPNRRFRPGRATDVLSFSLREGAHTRHRGALLGDVVIALGVAQRQARERGLALEAECRRLLIHGVLHLLGYDHARAAEARVMRAKERALWRKLTG